MSLNERVIDTAFYILENDCTVREAAKHFGVGKSTVHVDVTVRLRALDTPLYRKVKKVLDKNKSERHLRGGAATKKKYEKTLA